MKWFSVGSIPATLRWPAVRRVCWVRWWSLPTSSATDRPRSTGASIRKIRPVASKHLCLMGDGRRGNCRAMFRRGERTVSKGDCLGYTYTSLRSVFFSRLCLSSLQLSEQWFSPHVLCVQCHTPPSTAVPAPSISTLPR